MVRSLPLVAVPSLSFVGYCGKDDTSHTFGVWAHSLSAQSYKRLIDRGWRRSGHYLYRPNLVRSCCKLYTIKLDAGNFRVEKKHRQALNKFNKYVLGDSYRPSNSSISVPEMPDSVRQAANNKNEPTFNLRQAVHAAEYQGPDRIASRRCKFKVILEPASYSREKFNVYKKYQTIIHKDKESEVTSKGFRNFLCESPIQQETARMKNQPGYGSYHQLYTLDDTLIALAVIDILPGCISSVYFLYDPQYSDLSLGRVSACREASLAQDLQAWYYMGYYVPTCAKMKYKGEYSPSYLLDPATAIEVVPQSTTSDSNDQDWVELSRYMSIWSTRGKEHSSQKEKVNHLVSFKDEKLHSIDLPKISQLNVTAPAVLWSSDMPGLRSKAVKTNLNNVWILQDGTICPLASVQRGPESQLFEKVHAMGAMMGQDILSKAIITAD